MLFVCVCLLTSNQFLNLLSIKVERCSVLRGRRGGVHHGGAAQNGQECPLLPLGVVLRRHRPGRVPHRAHGAGAVGTAAVRPRPLDPHADRRAGHRRPELPHQGPADREGGPRGPHAHGGRAAGIRLPVHLLQPGAHLVEPGRSAVRGAQHCRCGAQEVVPKYSQVMQRPKQAVPGRKVISERAQVT